MIAEGLPSYYNAAGTTGAIAVDVGEDEMGRAPAEPRGPRRILWVGGILFVGGLLTIVGWWLYWVLRAVTDIPLPVAVGLVSMALGLLVLLGAAVVDRLRERRADSLQEVEF